MKIPDAGRAPGEVIYAKDLGLMNYGARAGLDPETIREVRAECASDAEAARRLGCSAATVSAARRDGTGSRNARNPWDRLVGGRADAGLFAKIIILLQRGGFWGVGAIATALGERESAVARMLSVTLSLGFVLRIDGMGYRLATEQEEAPLDDMRKHFAFARPCPKDAAHGVSAGKYCRVCKARLSRH